MAARTRTQKNAPAKDAQAELFEAFQAFLAQQNAPAKGKSTGSTRKTAPAKNRAVKGTITAGELWVALGAAPEYEPRDHERTQFLGRMLDLANSQGLLRLA